VNDAAYGTGEGGKVEIPGFSNIKKKVGSFLLMALRIKNPEADRLAREHVQLTNETLTEAVLRALRERLQREQGRKHGPDLFEEIRRIRERVACLPVRDARSADEIIGYDERGFPG
jgi:antitoxin VapB